MPGTNRDASGAPCLSGSNHGNLIALQGTGTAGEIQIWLALWLVGLLAIGSSYVLLHAGGESAHCWGLWDVGGNEPLFPNDSLSLPLSFSWPNLSSLLQQQIELANSCPAGLLSTGRGSRA